MDRVERWLPARRPGFVLKWIWVSAMLTGAVFSGAVHFRERYFSEAIGSRFRFAIDGAEASRVSAPASAVIPTRELSRGRTTEPCPFPAPRTLTTFLEGSHAFVRLERRLTRPKRQARITAWEAGQLIVLLRALRRLRSLRRLAWVVVEVPAPARRPRRIVPPAKCPLARSARVPLPRPAHRHPSQLKRPPPASRPGIRRRSGSAKVRTLWATGLSAPARASRHQ